MKTNENFILEKKFNAIKSFKNLFKKLKKCNFPEEDPVDNPEIQGDLHPEDIVLKLWQEDDTFCAREKISEWLGTNEPFRSKILAMYLNHFQFNKQTLDRAFRNLCLKLYLKAESQQIDRILEAFSKRYLECNPDCLFGSLDVVHAVSYSLLLLNTDLYMTNGPKMTRDSFVKNTMETIFTLENHPGLYKDWIFHMENLLKEIYQAVRSHPIYQPKPLQRSRTLPKSPAKEFKRYSTITPLEPQGLVMRKHVLESPSKKARFRQWQSCYLVMTATELLVYPKRRWQFSPEVIALNHCLATTMNDQAFCLETAEGGLILFESQDSSWVSSINRAAAKITKTTIEAVGNMDYGWNDTETLAVWYPPAPCMVKSQLDLRDQYRQFQVEIKHVSQQIDHHLTLKPLVDKRVKKKKIQM
ncbi:unnamed protein product [Rhizopus stolonifer]